MSFSAAAAGNPRRPDFSVSDSVFSSRAPLRTSRANRPEDRFPIRVLHLVNTLFTRVYHNMTVLRPCPLPRQGPAIVVCNHTSGLDPLLLQSACSRRLIVWMMAREYLSIPGMGKIFEILRVIPVDRGRRETTPLRSALRQLEAGCIVGIFPEGKISTIRELLDFQTGAAQLAIRGGVPIYPAYLYRDQCNQTMLGAFYQRSRNVIAFGSPVEFDRSNSHRETLRSATAAIRKAVSELRQDVDRYVNVR